MPARCLRLLFEQVATCNILDQGAGAPYITHNGSQCFVKLGTTQPSGTTQTLQSVFKLCSSSAVWSPALWPLASRTLQGPPGRASASNLRYVCRNASAAPRGSICDRLHAVLQQAMSTVHGTTRPPLRTTPAAWCPWTTQLTTRQQQSTLRPTPGWQPTLAGSRMQRMAGMRTHRGGIMCPWRNVGTATKGNHNGRLAP